MIKYEGIFVRSLPTYNYKVTTDNQKYGRQNIQNSHRIYHVMFDMAGLFTRTKALVTDHHPSVIGKSKS
jgi:hypothetical protein